MKTMRMLTLRVNWAASWPTEPVPSSATEPRRMIKTGAIELASEFRRHPES